MAKTKIEYGDRTWNPLTGCTIKSEGCVNCWAAGMAKRLKAMGKPEYQDVVDGNGHWTGVINLVPERLLEPLTWRKPQHVLVEFMGDLFHEKVSLPYLQNIFDVMKETPQHTYQTLTKRPENIKGALHYSVYGSLSNVILGVSIENQRRADERREYMRELSQAGWRTWVSYEPALRPVDWTGWEFLNQLVCGGESGPRARAMSYNSARDARDFCQANKIPFFFKQWGEWAPLAYCNWVTTETRFTHKPISVDDVTMVHVGKALAGHMLDGREWKEMPK